MQQKYNKMQNKQQKYSKNSAKRHSIDAENPHCVLRTIRRAALRFGNSPGAPPRTGRQDRPAGAPGIFRVRCVMRLRHKVVEGQ